MDCSWWDIGLELEENDVSDGAKSEHLVQEQSEGAEKSTETKMRVLHDCVFSNAFVTVREERRKDGFSSINTIRCS